MTQIKPATAQKKLSEAQQDYADLVAKQAEELAAARQKLRDAQVVLAEAYRADDGAHEEHEVSDDATS